MPFRDFIPEGQPTDGLDDGFRDFVPAPEPVAQPEVVEQPEPVAQPEVKGDKK